MPKLSAISLAVLLLSPASFPAAHAAPATAVAGKTLAERIDAGISGYYKADEPGATVIVTRDGATVFRKAYGVADVGSKQAMDAAMTLRLGSITKQFTAVAILMLAEQGKLALTDEISRFLPDYPTQGKKITIEHLLTHTSGIQSYTGKPSYSQTMDRDFSVSQMIDSFKNDPMLFAPGERFDYNNSGYFLLGAIIEKVSGQSYAQFLEQRIFTPLGMAHTAYEGKERSKGPRAAGHSKGETGFGPARPLSMTQPYAAGSLVSSVDDLARWDKAIADGKLLKPASWKKAFTPYKLADGNSTGYGYGWEIGRLNGSERIAHGGGINGFSTYALRVPGKKVFVAVLSNTESGRTHPEMVATKVAAIAIGKPFPDFKAITVAPKVLEQYVGVYKIDDQNTRTIRLEDGKLTMQRTGRERFPLMAYKENGFYFADSLATLEFVRNAKGQVTSLRMTHDGGDPVLHARTGEKPLERTAVAIAPATFDTYLGRYELEPGFVLEVKRDGDKMLAQGTGQPAIEILPLSDTVFFSKMVDAELHFEKNADGVVQLVLNQGGRKMPGKRL
ncbi:serine hydrolase [Massilia sp. GCM10020059]|uniref:Serine hydrolase n=1 Tax=Massilia agrisoli TaxID=2892444 RepID=A0ABS8ISP9_9BURK|nr:serine hydrolase [Massilia agrisoli]MCC6070279.1 serine hydrolase [Massilia agrisoli]